MGDGATMWSFGGRARRPPRQRPTPTGPEPGGTGPSGPGPGPMPDDLFSWEEPPQTGARPDDIEGTGQEIRDEDELPPGREPFGG
jgi:hypothetical protein